MGLRWCGNMRIIETFLRGQQPKNLPTLKERLGPNRLVAAGTVGTAITMAMYGLARSPATALAASLLAGLSWIAVLSSLSVSAQVALPEWVRDFVEGLSYRLWTGFRADLAARCSPSTQAQLRDQA